MWGNAKTKVLLFMFSKGRARGTGRSCSGARGGQLYELPAWGPIDVVWLGRGVGAGSLKILTGVLVHRVTRPLRGSVSCGSGWSVPCVSIQLTFLKVNVHYFEGFPFCALHVVSPRGRWLCVLP